MKVCPVCAARYDDSSNFCRRDGAQLVPDRAAAPEVVARRELLERRLAQEPENCELLLELGDLLTEIPLHDEALVQFFKALELTPGLEAARRKVAVIYRARGDWAEAARHLELLLDAHPADAPLLGELADVCQRAGRAADAADLLGRLTELAPADESAWRRRRDLLTELRRDEELAGVHRRLTELAPEELSNWFPLARRILLGGVPAPPEELARIERRLSRARAERESAAGQRASHVLLYLVALRLRLGTASPALRDVLREVDAAGLDGPHAGLAAQCLAELGDLALGGGDGALATDCYGASLKFQEGPRARAGLVRVHLDRARELTARARFREAVACCDEGLALGGESAELEEARRLAAGRHLRRSLVRGALVVGAALAVFVGFLYSQRRGPFGESPTPEDLTSSFSRFLSGQDFVSGLRKEKGGRELTFELRGEPWRVVIVRAEVAPNNDDTGSFRGTLETRWERSGAPVTGRRGLAPELLKAGIGPRATDARYNRYRRQWRW